MQFMSDGCKKTTVYLSEDLIDNKIISYADIIYQEDKDMVSKAVAGSLNLQQNTF